MSDYAVVLQKNDLVVKASAFGGIENIEFTKDGKVGKFSYKGVRYEAIYVFSTKNFIEYVDEAKFSKLIELEKAREGADYNGVSVDKWNNQKKPASNIAFKLYQELDAYKAVLDDDIYGIIRDSTGLCFYYATWKYKIPYTGPVNPTYANKSSFPCDILQDGTAAKSFYDNFKDRLFYDLATGQTLKDTQLVGEIAALIKTVDSQVVDAFNHFVLQGENHGEFKFFDNVTGNYTRAELLYYKQGLKRWLQIYAEANDKLKKLGDPERTYILCDLLYRYNMLTILSVDQKISILKTFCNGPLMDWYFASYDHGFQHIETLVVRVINSVTDAQAEEFLDKLISTTISVVNPNAQTSILISANAGDGLAFNQVCLYRILFQKIDDFFGQEHFTEFIKKLEELVLEKYGIVSNDANKISPETLKVITSAQFIWGSIRSRNKVNYTIESRSNQQVTIREKLCVQFKDVEVQNSNSLGIPTNSSYTITTCVKHLTKSIPLAHFDLVSIHFYENPSFIDLGDKVQYIEKNYLTFAGFIDYLIEKEDTKFIKDVAAVALTAISMTSGFGEVVAALRGVNFARGLLGITMVAGDLSVYLPQNSAFRDYIIKKYPKDHDTIFTSMEMAGTVFSLGGSEIAGSGILNTYSAAKASEFLGVARYILKDVTALEKLSANDLNILNKGLDTYYNGLYRIKYDIELAKDVNRAEATMKYYDNVPVRTEIFNQPEPLRFKFLEDFGPVNGEFPELLKDNSKYVGRWAGYSEQEKAFAKLDPLESLKIEINNIRFEKQYVRPGDLYKVLNGEELTSKYGVNAVNLVEVTENHLIALKTALSTTKQGDLVLVSGMVDNESGVVSAIFTNYSKKALRDKEYKNLIENTGANMDISKPYIQPNLRDRYLETLRRKGSNGEGYNLANPDDLDFTGKLVGAHAEFKALNDLSITKFGNIKVDQVIYDRWLKNVLGYNAYLSRSGIMPPCADCFYLTDLVTFIH